MIFVVKEIRNVKIKLRTLNCVCVELEICPGCELPPTHGSRDWLSHEEAGIENGWMAGLSEQTKLRNARLCRVEISIFFFTGVFENLPAGVRSADSTLLWYQGEKYYDK